MSPLASSMTELAKRATYTISDDYPYRYSGWSRNVIIIYAIVFIAILVLSALGALGALIVWCVRERKRKRWYGPTAQYYRDQGFGRTGMVGFNGAMYVPQVVYVPFGGQPGGPQGPPGPIAGGPMPGPGMMPYGQHPQFAQNPQVPQNLSNQNQNQNQNQGQVLTPGNQPQPQLQPINTSVAYNRSFGAVYNVNTGVASGSGSGNASGSGSGDVAAGISQRDMEGPTSPIRDFNGAGAYDPFASPRVQAYPAPSNPPPQPESSSSGAPASHGITEVPAPVPVHDHGVQQPMQMAEKGDVGLTRANHTLSFYAIPMGSQSNVAAAGKSGQ